MVFERREAEVVNFSTHYRVNVPAVESFEVLLEERMEEVKEFKYLGTVQCKHGEMEGEIRESYVRHVCYRITCKGNERKECVHGGKARFKKQYYHANIDVWIRDLDMG